MVFIILWNLTFKRQMANCAVAAINQTFKGKLAFGSWNDRVENHAAYPLPIEGEMPRNQSENRNKTNLNKK